MPSRRHSTYLGILLVIALLLTSSCQQTEGIHLFRPTPSTGWAQNDTIIYSLPAAEHSSDYDLQVELRIDNRYAYQDLWLVLDQTYQTRQEQKRRSYTTVELKQRQEQAKHETHISHHQHYSDTLQLQLTDGHRLNGTGRDLLVYRFPIRFVHLVRQEQGTITVRHIMDCDTLQGIHDVGISFLPTK